MTFVATTGGGNLFVALLHTLIHLLPAVVLHALAAPTRQRAIRADFFLLRCNRRASAHGRFQVRYATAKWSLPRKNLSEKNR